MPPPVRPRRAPFDSAGPATVVAKPVAGVYRPIYRLRINT